MSEPTDLLRRFALALATWREARGESLLGKLLVCQVIENRVVDARWPETYIGVITQPLQFSAFNANDPNVSTFPRDSDPMWADAVAAADLVIAAPSVLTTANHYHTTVISPTWSQGKRPVLTEGNHAFYRL